MCGGVEGKMKQGRLPSMGRPSGEALAMAGFQRMAHGACCTDDVDDGMPPEHLRAFEAYLEKVVPAEMIVVSRREEDARLQRGGKPRCYDDDLKEKLRLWAKAVAKQTMGRR